MKWCNFGDSGGNRNFTEQIKMVFGQYVVVVFWVFFKQNFLSQKCSMSCLYKVVLSGKLECSVVLFLSQGVPWLLNQFNNN